MSSSSLFLKCGEEGGYQIYFYERRVVFCCVSISFPSLSQDGSNPGLVMDLFSAILPCYDLTNAFMSNLLQMVPFAVNVFCLGILEIHFERKFC
jgi:MFS superfamily sulfate permease-like transporter